MFVSPQKNTHLVFVSTTEPLLVLPEERACIASASAARQEEFLLGRTAARKLMHRLGLSGDEPILQASSGAPVFPSTMLGSISHTSGGAVAFGALRQSFRALGVDIERSNRTFRQDVSGRVCASSQEHDEIRTDSRALLRIFAAKESLYKALHPITNTYFGFQDAVVRFEPHNADVCTIELQRSLGEAYPAGSSFTGFFLEDHTYCIALVVEPRPS